MTVFGRQCDQRPDCFDGIVVVGVQRQEIIGIRKRLGGCHGVSGPVGHLLDREIDAQSFQRHLLAVVFADRCVFGADHQTDSPDARICQRGQHVIQERAADRNHGFDPRIRRRGLITIQSSTAGRLLHSLAQPAGHHHRLVQLIALHPSAPCSALWPGSAGGLRPYSP